MSRGVVGSTYSLQSMADVITGYLKGLSRWVVGHVNICRTQECNFFKKN